MNRPQRYLTRMAIFLMLVAIAVAALYGQLRIAFLANAILNGLILGVLLLGIVYSFRQVLSLRPEIAWMGRLREESKERLIYPEGLAAERGAVEVGHALDECQVTVIGDTVEDTLAARAIGAQCLLVATGHAEPEALQITAPGRMVMDLSEPQALELLLK